MGNNHLCVLSCVWLFVNLWTLTHQAPLSMGFSRQEYWSGFPCPPPGNLPNPGTESTSQVSFLGRRVLYHQRHLMVNSITHSCIDSPSLWILPFPDNLPLASTKTHTNMWLLPVHKIRLLCFLTMSHCQLRKTEGKGEEGIRGWDE